MAAGVVLVLAMSAVAILVLVIGGRPTQRARL
jgi:hypothetical protein